MNDITSTVVTVIALVLGTFVATLVYTAAVLYTGGTAGRRAQDSLIVICITCSVAIVLAVVDGLATTDGSDVRRPASDDSVKVQRSVTSSGP